MAPLKILSERLPGKVFIFDGTKCQGYQLVNGLNQKGHNMKGKILLFGCALLSFGCKSSYQKGFDVGYDEGFNSTYQDAFDNGYSDGNTDGQSSGNTDGYNHGHSMGYAQGYSESRDLYATDEYLSGYADGDASGYADGYDNGHADGLVVGGNAGYNDGQDHGYTDGYASTYNGAYNDGYDDAYGSAWYDGEDDGQVAGYNDGQDDGYVDGYDDSFDVAYDDGYDDGFNNSYNDGYNHGADDGYGAGWDAGYDDGYDDNYNYAWDEGYDNGYDDGYYDGYGYSKSSSPLAKLASQVNSDMINYSALKKFDSKSAIENGTIVFSGDTGSVDIEKLAALKERHYLNEMSGQLMAKFGLSYDSASRMATVAHQFNRLAGTRALTDEDASAFTKELVGFDMGQIENAVKKSMKGESSELNQLLKKASEKVGVTPEKMNNMITEIFY